MSATPVPTERRRVLVAEDDRVVRLAIRRTLVRGGYDVAEVEDGTRLREALRAADAPPLVVTDWLMPGATGVEIARELRARPDGGRFYIIMVTGRTERADLVEAMQAGADDYVPKPFHPGELLARVNAGRRVVDLQVRLESRIAELAAAVAEVKTLRGMIPICMHCHRIRTDREGWQKLEGYLEEHSEAVVSHALCEECLAEFYPEQPAGKAEDPPCTSS
jgi:DNA-binding response OmpR family regulator